MNSTLSGMHSKDSICPLVYREFSLESLFYIHLSLCKVVVKICTQTMRSPRIYKMHSFEIVHLFGRVLKASDPKTPAPWVLNLNPLLLGVITEGTVKII